MQQRKKYDHERVGCTKGWMPGAEAIAGALSFVSTGVHERERGT